MSETKKQILHGGNVDMKLLSFFGIPEEDYLSGITDFKFSIEVGYCACTEYTVYTKERIIVKKMIEYTTDMEVARRWEEQTA